MWSPLIDRMKKCFNGWKVWLLSKGGRLTLIKASLASIPIHYLSLLVLRSSVCHALEKIQRDFLWRKGRMGKVCTWFLGKECVLLRIEGKQGFGA